MKTVVFKSVFLLTVWLNLNVSAGQGSCTPSCFNTTYTPQIFDFHLLTDNDFLRVCWTPVLDTTDFKHYDFKYANIRENCSHSINNMTGLSSTCLEVPLDDLPGNENTSYYFQVSAVYEEERYSSKCIIHRPRAQYDISGSAGDCVQEIEYCGNSLPIVLMNTKRCLLDLSLQCVCSIVNTSVISGLNVCPNLCLDGEGISCTDFQSADVVGICEYPVMDFNCSSTIISFCNYNNYDHIVWNTLWHINAGINQERCDSQCHVNSVESQSSCMSEPLLTTSILPMNNDAHSTTSILPMNNDAHSTTSILPMTNSDTDGTAAKIISSAIGGLLLAIITIHCIIGIVLYRRRKKEGDKNIYS